MSGKPEPGAGAGLAAQSAGAVWIEGEDAVTTTFNRHGWYGSDGVRTDLLSPGWPGERPGAWLAHYSNDGRSVEAVYSAEIPALDEYRFWVRASAYQTAMWIGIDGGPAIPIDTQSERREYTNLVAPGIDIRFLAWLPVGSFALASGAHQITIGLEVHPEVADRGEVHGGIDALVLVPEGAAWSPTGPLRPGQKEGPGEVDEWYPFIPPDPFVAPAAGNPLDVSDLLHRPAGVRGAVRREGDRLVFDDGSPAVFWGVNAHPPASAQAVARQARFLARAGVNLVRLHPVQSVIGFLRGGATGSPAFDPERMDDLDRWFAALKAEGIYVQFSPVYPHVIRASDGYDPALYAELPDADAWTMREAGSGKRTSGFVNFVPELQALEGEWVAALLDHVNPYTGLRYADDPGLAIVEVHNEDSIFWHFPLNDLRDGDYPLHLARLQSGWARWLASRYRSDAEMFDAWGPVGAGRRAEDSLSNTAPAIYGAWEMGPDGPVLDGAESRRMGDFIRYLAETQRGYFTEREALVRDLGFEGVTVTTAWQAGGPAAHLPNLWTDTAADMIDRHAYFGGGSGGHNVRAGEVASGSHLGRPGSGIFERALEQVEDRPFMLSEWNQSPPNQWKAEIAPLFAFYGMGLNGWDASTHFTAGTATGMDGGWPSERSYASETPHYLGQFPALSRSVLRGDISAGGIVAARRLALEDIFLGIDPLQRSLPGGGWAGAGGSLETPGQAMAMGRVTVAIAGPGAGARPSERADWDALWDRAAEVVRSGTGELEWDYGSRVVVASAPRTHAVIGFAGARTYELPAADIEIDTGFVSLLLTSLDGRPLTSSNEVLLTALARDRQSGALYSEDGTRLLEVGGPPLMLEPVRATIRWKGLDLSEVTALDAAGRPLGRPVPLEGAEADTFRIDGRYRAHYYLLHGGRPDDPPTPRPTPTRTPTGAPTASVSPTSPPPAPLEHLIYLPRLSLRASAYRPALEPPGPSALHGKGHSAPRLRSAIDRSAIDTIPSPSRSAQRRAR